MLARILRFIVLRLGLAKSVSVKLLQRHQIVKVITKNHTYHIVIVDPEKKEVAVQSDNHEYFFCQEMCLFRGSTYGTSVIWMDRIAKDMHMEMKLKYDASPLSVITTSRVRKFRVINDLMLAERIIARAQSSARLQRVDKGALPS